MNTKRKYKTVNLSIREFDIIKEYCNKHSIKMPKWMTQLAMNVILEGEKQRYDNHKKRQQLVADAEKLKG